MDIKEKINELRLRITEYDSGAEDHFFKMGILDILEILNGREARQNEISKNVNQAFKNINARLDRLEQPEPQGKWNNRLLELQAQLSRHLDLHLKDDLLEELKPCPFCGRQKVVAIKTWEIYRVECCNYLECAAKGGGFASEKDAIESWNRRSNA